MAFNHSVRDASRLAMRSTSADRDLRPERVRLLAAKANISIHELRAPKIKCDRVIEETVAGIANYVVGLALLPDKLNRFGEGKAAEWFCSIRLPRADEFHLYVRDGIRWYGQPRWRCVFR